MIHQTNHFSERRDHDASFSLRDKPWKYYQDRQNSQISLVDLQTYIPILQYYTSFDIIIIIIIIIISLLMSPMLVPKPINAPTTRAHCGLVGANDGKCSRDQRLNLPSEARTSSR
jgi:hypothetical protein